MCLTSLYCQILFNNKILEKKYSRNNEGPLYKLEVFMSLFWPEADFERPIEDSGY